MMREYIVKVTDSIVQDAFQRFENEWSPEQEIVRCKDCKYRNDLWNCHIAHEGYTTTDDWFCANGERSDKTK